MGGCVATCRSGMDRLYEPDASRGKLGAIPLIQSHDESVDLVHKVLFGQGSVRPGESRDDVTTFGDVSSRGPPRPASIGSVDLALDTLARSLEVVGCDAVGQVAGATCGRITQRAPNSSMPSRLRSWG